MFNISHERSISNCSHISGGCVDKITVDVIIPVYNEENLLECSLEKLTEFFATQKDLVCSFVIASNGSTDRTKEIGENLAQKHSNVRFFHILKRGRGRALKKAFSESKALVCVYTDVDLSVDISVLSVLIKLAAEHKSIAMPNRRVSYGHIRRPLHRIFFSVIYNLLIRLLFPKTKIKDAQVGMKAIHCKILETFLKQVENNNFFFDTELLLLAERAGHPIIQIPTDCYDMRRGKVNLILCIFEELLGLIKMRIKSI